MKTDLLHEANHSVWTWREVGASSNPCARSRFKHAACLIGGYVYLFGGKDGRTPLKDFWRYHLASVTWECLSYRGEVLPHLEGHTLVAYQRLIFIFGGELSDGLQGPPLWILNTDLLHVRKIICDNEASSGPTGRRDHTAVVYSNAMYVYGGFIDLKGSTAEFWTYSINEEQWSEVRVRSGQTPGGRHGHSVVVARKSMWLFGGMNGLAIKSDVWKFNFSVKTWQRLKCFGSPPPITGHSAHVIDNMMYVIGGEAQGELKNDVWCLPLDTLSWRKIYSVQSPALMPPCTQHASVWIDARTSKQESDNCRCLSEPFLQSQPHSDSLQVRPVSSPPATFFTNGRSSPCNKISPIFNTSTSSNDHIPTKERDYSTNCGSQTIYPILAKCGSMDNGKGDRENLLRPVSVESVRGLDNVVVCLQDEEQGDAKYQDSHYWNKTSKTEIHTNNRPFSVNSSKTTSQTFDCDQTKPNQMDSFTLDKSYHGKQQPLHNSVIRQNRRSRKSCLADSSENCPNPSKAIRSYLCNDLYVEDLEMVNAAEFVESVNFSSPFQKKESPCSESIELCEVSTNPPLYKSVDLDEMFTSDIDFEISSNPILYKPDDMDKTLSCDTDMCLEHTDVCDSNSGLTNILKLPSEEKCHEMNYTNCQPMSSSKLVTIGTQTDTFECCLRNDHCHSQNVEQFSNQPHIQQQNSLAFTDSQVFRGKLLIMGGKVTQGHILSKPISLWVAEIS